MQNPVVASNKPYLVTLSKAGKTYYWCACGKSQKQPFCDGSHKGTGIEPIAFKAPQVTQELLLCGCKQSSSGPYCDGSHNGLSDTYDLASDEECAASAHIQSTGFSDGDTGKALLDGGCYIRRLSESDYTALGNWSVAQSIAETDGAQHLGQWQLNCRASVSNPISFGASEVALYVVSGHGTLNIAGRIHNIAPQSGIYIAPHETFSYSGDGEISLIAVVCPIGPKPLLHDEMSDNFNVDIQDRVTASSGEARTAMADRFYQVLVGDEDGKGDTEITEFIGEVPKSRAAAHRHMYEEAITILSGEGFMWTEGARAAVKPGDIIFLPKKQLHSLECTSENGMRLMGAFYPSGSPAINY